MQDSHVATGKLLPTRGIKVNEQRGSGWLSQVYGSGLDSPVTAHFCRYVAGAPSRAVTQYPLITWDTCQFHDLIKHSRGHENCKTSS